jgi:hypothetical protein
MPRQGEIGERAQKEKAGTQNEGEKPVGSFLDGGAIHLAVGGLHVVQVWAWRNGGGTCE